MLWENSKEKICDVVESNVWVEIWGVGYEVSWTLITINVRIEYDELCDESRIRF